MELPEFNSPVYPLTLDVTMDDGASTSSDGTPSPVIPMVRRRFGSLLGRSSAPKSSSRPSTPVPLLSQTSAPPPLVTPTPKWKTAPSVREQGWMNVPATPDYARERRRTMSMQAPIPRPATAAVSEWSIESSSSELKAKPHSKSKSPHAPSPVSSSRRSERAETPELKKQAQASAALILQRSSSTRPAERRPVRDVDGANYGYGAQETRAARSASRTTAASSASGSSASSTKRPVKGILKMTKPTPVNSAALLAPSPSESPVPLPVARGAVPRRPPSNLMLHWQLLYPNPARGRWVRFDIAFSPTLVRRYSNEHPGRSHPIIEQDRSKNAAAGLQLTRMTIRCPTLPHWAVDVANAAGITCGDVFDAIHKTFTAPLSAAEQVQYVTEQNRSAVEQAFKQRCKDVPGLDRKHSLLRIDLLLGRRIFAGLSLAGEDRCDLWEMLTMSET